MDVQIGSDKKKYPIVKVNDREMMNTDAGSYSVSFVNKHTAFLNYGGGKLKIRWTGHDIQIEADSRYLGQTCGLCGTFDQNPENDYHGRSDVVETNVNDFVKGWIYTAPEVSSAPSCTQVTEGRELSDSKYCSVYRERASSAAAYCEVIKSKENVFKDCHSVLAPKMYYDMCMEDYCKSKEPDNHCKTLGAYAMMCMELGVDLTGWREVTEHCGK